ncbi:MAG: 4-hydroxy-3-methylbut-2-enyl diphosphate reductase [Deltaproteobacteria bacterium]|nr:4-hydroxy-3-methylbut-2-enyl diphosphate reductase [Deltaproteobacteria bacterium]
MSVHPQLDFKMNRKGFGLKEAIKEDLHTHYHSDIIQEIKEAGFSKSYGDLAIHLAREFGFCYGVDRAVELAYETKRRFPDKRIFLTTEIIHNPLVNSNLRRMGVRFLSGPYQDATLDEVKPDDVVIVPAFGTTVSQLRELADKKCELVDTICASVIVVWKRVEKYAQEGFTVLVHGKVYHEETQATTSRVSVFPGGKYLVVFDENEAQEVCDYIVGGGKREEFILKFTRAMSPDFDPDRDLVKIGLANQTTMLSSESLKIAGMIKRAFVQRYGEGELINHFRSFDTICNATQERQDAILGLKEKNPDFIIVIGGYNSSNTNHLCEIAESIAPTYHIDRANCVVSEEVIRHKPFGKREEIETCGWLKSGPVSIGITAGASTPNQVMGETLARILSFRAK